VSQPVNEKDLTLKEAEDLLETWKLRGQGGWRLGNLDNYFDQVINFAQTDGRV
jgi:hypothetical protein